LSVLARRADDRCAVETQAMDSYQNLLFSVIKFRHPTGSYSTKITVITQAFKECRFLELPGPAIKYCTSRGVEGVWD
jgi:hypothetical protein